MKLVQFDFKYKGPFGPEMAIAILRLGIPQLPLGVESASSRPSTGSGRE
jgi:hypothetical protein